MRYFEIAGGARIPVDHEEHDLLERASGTRLEDAGLDEREQEVARKMVSKGLLNFINGDDGAYYETNKLEDVWRI